MFTTGSVLLPFFSFMTLLIAVPTGVKFFNWAGTMWKGQITFEPPMLFTVGFLITFLFGGINVTFLVQHWIGDEGMPRRIANYPGFPERPAFELHYPHLHSVSHPRGLEARQPEGSGGSGDQES